MFHYSNGVHLGTVKPVYIESRDGQIWKVHVIHNVNFGQPIELDVHVHNFGIRACVL